MDDEAPSLSSATTRTTFESRSRAFARAGMCSGFAFKEVEEGASPAWV
jgi:hypothetical protein